MNRQELRDGSYRLLGWLEQVGDRIEARDYTGQLRGWYEPRSDQTRDRSGALVGTGNMLSSLITDRRC